MSGGWLLRGWCEDYWFYSCNNHPLLILWFTDPENPFSPYERRVDFVFTTAVTLLGAALLLVWKDGVALAVESEAPSARPVLTSVVSCIFVSLPVMVTRVASFYVIGCPCLLSDLTTLDPAAMRRYAVYLAFDDYKVA